MTPVSSVGAGAVRPAAAERIGRRPQRPEEEMREREKKPAVDEYVPEEKEEPSGRYWLGRDDDGGPKVCFDAPAEDRKAVGPKAPERKAETCVGNTDDVDREIRMLKKKRDQLEQQLGREKDVARREDLERELSQVERELRQKDNDTYRRQHSKFS